MGTTDDRTFCLLWLHVIWLPYLATREPFDVYPSVVTIWFSIHEEGFCHYYTLCTDVLQLQLHLWGLPPPQSLSRCHMMSQYVHGYNIIIDSVDWGPTLSIMRKCTVVILLHNLIGERDALIGWVNCRPRSSSLRSSSTIRSGTELPRSSVRLTSPLQQHQMVYSD